jgi:ABC-type transporter Mla subunit MlaD
MGCGCLTLIVIAVAIIAIVVALSGHKSVAQQASSYIAAHGSDISGVQASVQAVQVDIKANSSIDQLAQDAQQAHDNIDSVRDDFALNTTMSGALGNDETEVFGAANDLKNAMGALVTYTGNSNPATLAKFKSQYQNAAGEWNDGISGIWSLAGKTNPPTI